MKLCVTCHISNVKVKFAGSQCVNCYELSPVQEFIPVVITYPKREKRIKVPKVKKVKREKKKAVEKEFVGRRKKTYEDRFPDRKDCSKCGENKHISFFYVEKRGGREFSASECKSCRHALNKTWKNKNKEKVLEYHKEYNKTYKRK